MLMNVTINNQPCTFLHMFSSCLQHISANNRSDLSQYRSLCPAKKWLRLVWKWVFEDSWLPGMFSSSTLTGLEPLVQTDSRLSGAEIWMEKLKCTSAFENLFWVQLLHMFKMLCVCSSVCISSPTWMLSWRSHSGFTALVETPFASQMKTWRCLEWPLQSEWLTCNHVSSN